MIELRVGVKVRIEDSASVPPEETSDKIVMSELNPVTFIVISCLNPVTTAIAQIITMTDSATATMATVMAGEDFLPPDERDSLRARNKLTPINVDKN